MAIQTGGFMPTNFARYIPSDPSLVALQPQNFSEGFMSSLKIADTLAKLKAERARQAEVDALAADRVNAAKTGYKATAAQDKNIIDNADASGKVVALDLANKIRSLPKEGLLFSANLDSKIEQQPFLANAAMLKSVGEAERAEGANDIASLQQKAEKAKAELEATTEETKARFLKEHPEATEDLLNATLLANKNVLAKHGAFSKVSDELSDLQAKQAVEEAKAATAIAQYTEKTGLKPATGILPAGIEFARGIERRAAGLGLTPEQLTSVMGKQEGVALLNKMEQQKRTGFSIPLTDSEKKIYNGLFMPSKAQPTAEAATSPITPEQAIESLKEKAKSGDEKAKSWLKSKNINW